MNPWARCLFWLCCLYYLVNFEMMVYSVYFKPGVFIRPETVCVKWHEEANLTDWNKGELNNRCFVCDKVAVQYFIVREP